MRELQVSTLKFCYFTRNLLSHHWAPYNCRILPFCWYGFQNLTNFICMDSARKMGGLHASLPMSSLCKSLSYFFLFIESRSVQPVSRKYFSSAHSPNKILIIWEVWPFFFLELKIQVGRPWIRNSVFKILCGLECYENYRNEAANLKLVKKTGAFSIDSTPILSFNLKNDNPPKSHTKTPRH
jgi:hypothetical protein